MFIVYSIKINLKKKKSPFDINILGHSCCLHFKTIVSNVCFDDEIISRIQWFVKNLEHERVANSKS